ncbi:small ribosomal subunit protein uS14m [Salvelinus alpinus]|uniref:28S ribosomal protein S14, mitochondrial n=1 Tax=Salvelinus namaycush TaxID=8040 RepID=A0A8U0P6T9_SALNM|nr:28S ribosomal protein S14, mitochondrial [Salvelinus alpinus]XP_038819375.1 28S ribosomal protein S14, mitochondrial [Salvelinus namaycush]XP_055739265.1 28S ribosomal protein S14, mitochondrial [Salvelinus fontinalis]
MAAACRTALAGLNVFHSFCTPKQTLRSGWSVVEQVRGYYVDWRMLRDVKRRQMAFDYADERLRINALRKNTVLPKELQDVADKEIAALPRDSCPVRIRNRCVMTSRPRGVKRRWRLSRIVFRHLADHNQMSGIQRAMW